MDRRDTRLPREKETEKLREIELGFLETGNNAGYSDLATIEFDDKNIS
jgi:hypothetical protein